MEIFYSDHIQGEEIVLPEEESAHCVRVLRHRLGDEVKVSGGDGNLYSCVIVDDHVRRVVLNIRSVEGGVGKHNYFLHVAVAPTKNIDRFEWFLEKSTEIGIDEITPLLCDRSERKVVKEERCRRVVIAAAKQSLKGCIPQVNAMIPSRELIRRLSGFEGLKCIAYCDRDERILLRDLLRENQEKCDRVAVLIGPEGDFSSQEVELARKAGFIPVSLGEARLRTETAALMSVAAMWATF